jgi:hypothetical protein
MSAAELAARVTSWIADREAEHADYEDYRRRSVYRDEPVSGLGRDRGHDHGRGWVTEQIRAEKVSTRTITSTSH